DAGMRIDPPVSVPSDAIDIWDATAAPDPPLEPPGIFVRSHGFLHGPKCGLVVVAPHAYSCILSLPVNVTPDIFSFETTVASKSATNSLWMLDPIVAFSSLK